MLCTGCWCCCCCRCCCFSAAILHIVVVNCGKNPTRIAMNWPIDELNARETLACVHTVAWNYFKLLPFVMRHRAPIFLQTHRPIQPTDRPTDRPTHNTLKWSGHSVRARSHHMHAHTTRSSGIFVGFKTQISPLPWEINKCDKALCHANSLISFLSRVYHKCNNRTDKTQPNTKNGPFFQKTPQHHTHKHIHYFVYSCPYAWMLEKSAPNEHARVCVIAFWLRFATHTHIQHNCVMVYQFWHS